MRFIFLGLKGLPPKFGGLQFDAEEIGGRLVDLGCDIIVYCRKWYTDPNLDYYKGMNLVNVFTINNRHIDVIIHTFFSIIHAFRYYRSHENYLLFSYGSYFIIPLLKLSKKKVGVILGGEPWKDLNVSKLGRIVCKINYKIALKYADYIFAESIPIYNQVKPNTKSLLKYTPVGRMNLLPKYNIGYYKSIRGAKEKYILFLGRIERVKNIELLIKAFKLSALKESASLVIAGSSRDAEYLKYLKGIYKDVKFIGNVEGDNKIQLMTNCLAMVLPSVSEGMPTVLIESMELEVVNIVSNIPAHKSLINNHLTGLIFKNNDVTSLISTLNNIESNNLKKIGENARAYIIDNHCWNKTVGVILDSYR